MENRRNHGTLRIEIIGSLILAIILVGGTLWMERRAQKETEDETEYIFGAVSGLRLICFVAPEENGEGSAVISTVDDGISAVDFHLSEDGGTVKMDATINYVPGQDDEFFFYNPVLLAASFFIEH